jgi:hypothetical protein
MINLYIFLAVLIGILILISIKFTFTTPNSSSNNINYSNNQQEMLNYYRKYGSLSKYSNYTNNKI